LTVPLADAAEKEPRERGLAASGWVSSTYFAEGLPYSVVHQIASQFFTAMNASLESIGLVSLYGLAWNLKFTWSPLVDMFGTARRWLIVLELLLAAAIGWIAWPAHHGDLGAVAKVLVIVAVLAATHDIAIDGFYLQALKQRDQAAHAGLRVAAYRVALLVGNGALVWLAGTTSWRTCFLAAAGLMATLALVHHLLLPRPDASFSDESARPNVEKQGCGRFLDAFLSFFRQPRAAISIAFVLVFRLGDAMMFSMSTPLQRDLGIDTSTRGVVGGIGTAIGIAGTIVAARIIASRGLRATLVPIAIIQGAALPVYALVAALRPGFGWIVAAVFVEQLAAGIGTAGFSVFLMRLCAGQYKASHFAIASALMSLAATLSGSASGFIARPLGYTWFFLIASLGALPGVLLSLVVVRGMPLTPALSRAAGEGAVGKPVS